MVQRLDGCWSIYVLQMRFPHLSRRWKYVDNLRALVSACTCEDNYTQSGTKMIWNHDTVKTKEIQISLYRNKWVIFIMKTEFVTFDHFTHEMFSCDSQRVVIHREIKPRIDAYMYFTAGDLSFIINSYWSKQWIQTITHNSLPYYCHLVYSYFHNWPRTFWKSPKATNRQIDTDSKHT